MAASRAFLLQWHGYGLTTAEIHYHLPERRLCGDGLGDHDSLRPGPKTASTSSPARLAERGYRPPQHKERG